MARIHGKGGQVLADPAGGSTLVALAAINSWTLDMATDKVDVTAFGDLNKQYVQGLPDVKGTFSGWYDNVDLVLFNIAVGTTPATLKLVPNTVAPTHYWQGLAYLDASVSVSATGAVSIGGSFVAAGPWTRNP